jgi:Na+-driven multidrug efflux pump
VVFNFLLIPTLGMPGCAWATAVAMLVGTITYSLLLRRVKVISFSWAYFAMIPAIVGAVSISAGGNVILSLLLCMGLVFLVAFWKRQTLSRSLTFLMNPRNRI